MPKARRPVPPVTPTGPVPTGPAPTGPAPTGSAPTGSALTGSALTGSVPAAAPGAPAPAPPPHGEQPVGRPQQEVLRVAGVPVLMAAMVAAPGSVGPLTAAPAGTHTASPAQSAGQAAGRPAVQPAGQGTTVPRTGGGDGGGRAGGRPVHVAYTVRDGDTLSGIAERAGTPLRTVLTANGLSAQDLILPGQRLVLPKLRVPLLNASRRAPRPVVHRVVAGDTVSGVADRYGVDPRAVLRANRLDPAALIHPGRKLVVPGARATTPRRVARRPAPTHAYTVRRDDTLSGIAATARTDLGKVLALNHLTPSSVLRPGQRILLPGRGPRPAADRPARGPADAVRTAAAANRAALAHRPAPSKVRTRALIRAAAARLGVDPALALAVAYQESGFNQRRVSGANAIGVMQVIPSSGRWASGLVGRELDLLDARDNVVAGVAILAALTAKAPEPTAIAAYYQGMAAVTEHGMFPDTRRYVANVQTLKRRFS